jgi:diguanylate cyclase (GGDEF)-like protein
VTITEYLGTLPKPVLIVLGTFWLIAVSAADYFTHFTYLLEFSPFYLVPVSFFSWFIGRRSGVAVAVASVAVGFMIRFRDASIAVAYWNALILSALYITATFMIVQLKHLYERERDLSRIDPLTNIPNRRALHEAASQARSLAERNQTPFSICYIDVDKFKSINDRFGHSAGDRVLALAAAAISGALRPSDVVARMGGDEFAVLLPGAHSDAAAGIMRRVGDELQHAMRQHGWPVTFSIGTASFTPPLVSVAEMLAEADKAMYAEKKKGREPLDRCDVVT